jgi:glycosyltransferase involved in cell wall biosynthesis
MAETLSHTSLSAVRAIIKDKPDVALVLNAGNAPLIKPLQAAGIPVAIHLDGVESKREKWRGAGARYYRWAEKVAVKNGDAVIADAQSIADHVRAAYGRECVVIPYGADIIDPGSDRLAELGVIRRDYHLVVARLEPENHVLEAVHGYTISEETRPLLVVGSAPYSQWYIDRVHEVAEGHPSVRLLGSIYDHDLLNQLYANARTYVHGHSVGGTNPSLLRAMGAGAPVLAYDCEFNREVTAQRAFFWSDAESLAGILDEVAEGEIDDELVAMSTAGRERIAQHYQWDAVTDDYQALIEELSTMRSPRRRAIQATPAEPRT